MAKTKKKSLSKIKKKTMKGGVGWLTFRPDPCKKVEKAKKNLIENIKNCKEYKNKSESESRINEVLDKMKEKRLFMPLPNNIPELTDYNMDYDLSHLPPNVYAEPTNSTENAPSEVKSDEIPQYIVSTRPANVGLYKTDEEKEKQKKLASKTRKETIILDLKASDKVFDKGDKIDAIFSQKGPHIYSSGEVIKFLIQEAENETDLFFVYKDRSSKQLIKLPIVLTDSDKFSIELPVGEKMFTSIEEANLDKLIIEILKLKFKVGDKVVQLKPQNEEINYDISLNKAKVKIVTANQFDTALGGSRTKRKKTKKNKNSKKKYKKK